MEFSAFNHTIQRPIRVRRNCQLNRIPTHYKTKSYQTSRSCHQAINTANLTRSLINSLTPTLRRRQDIAIFVTIPIRQATGKEEVIPDIRVRNIDAEIAVRAAFAAVDGEAGVLGAVEEFVGGADVAGVEIPAAWLLVVDSFAYNPFSRVGWMVWLWRGREGKGREGKGREGRGLTTCRL